GRGFVEEDQLGIVEQGLRKSDALQHAFGKIAQLFAAMWRQAHQLQQRRHAFAQLIMRHAIKAAMQIEKFGASKPVIKTEVFGEETDSAACTYVAGGTPQNRGRPRSRRDQV